MSKENFKFQARFRRAFGPISRKRANFGARVWGIVVLAGAKLVLPGQGFFDCFIPGILGGTGVWGI